MQKGSFLNYILLVLAICAPVWFCYGFVSLWVKCSEKFPKFGNWRYNEKALKWVCTLAVVAVVVVVLLTGTAIVWFIPLMFFVF